MNVIDNLTAGEQRAWLGCLRVLERVHHAEGQLNAVLVWSELPGEAPKPKPKTVKGHMRSLERKGWLKREPTGDWTIAVVPPWNDPDVEWRCEAHPDKTWETGTETDCDCGGGVGVPYLNGEPWVDPRERGAQ